jgi:GDP-L-fucose synthase
MQHNIKMFMNLARCTGAYGKLLNLGSGAEYAKTHMGSRAKEDDAGHVLPLDDYGISKYLMSTHIERTPGLYSLRLFGVFGKYEDWRIRFVSNVICKAMYDLPLSVRQNTVFDYIDVDDLAPLLAWFIENTPAHKTYNVCRGTGIDLVSIAKTVLEVTEKSLPIAILKDGWGAEYTGDNSRMLAEMGSFAFCKLLESIERLHGWYLSQKASIDPAVLAACK